MSTLSFPFLRAIETKRPAATPRHAPRDLAPLPANLTAERALDVQHYTDRPFGFRITRPICREAAELRYSEDSVNALPDDPLVGEAAALHVLRYATCTRDTCLRPGRITDLVSSGKMFSDISIAPLDRGTDRAMICGAPPFVHDMQRILTSAGLVKGANASPADFVVEKAFVG